MFTGIVYGVCGAGTCGAAVLGRGFDNSGKRH